jgi:hypothetical protein
LATNSACLNAGGLLSSNVVPAHQPVQQYVKHQQSEPRPAIDILDIGAFEVSSPLETWRLAQFGNSATDVALSSDIADPDGDGVINFLEYAFGQNPLSPSTAGLPHAEIISTNGADFISISFAIRPPPSGIVYTVQTSSNLLSWLDGCRFSDTTNIVSAGETVEISHPAATNKIVRMNIPNSASAAKYLRVIVGKQL